MFVLFGTLVLKVASTVFGRGGGWRFEGSDEKKKWGDFTDLVFSGKCDTSLQRFTVVQLEDLQPSVSLHSLLHVRLNVTGGSEVRLSLTNMEQSAHSSHRLNHIWGSLLQFYSLSALC